MAQLFAGSMTIFLETDSSSNVNCNPENFILMSKNLITEAINRLEYYKSNYLMIEKEGENVLENLDQISLK